MKNNNGAAIRKLSVRSLRNNRVRNLFAILAIVLTGMLFTATFSLLGGIIQVSERETMHEVGTTAHAGLKAVTMQQYEDIAADPLVRRSSYNIYIGVAQNLVKRQAEVRYVPSEKDLQDYFITLQEGRMPMAEDEIIVDTFVMDELKIPHSAGQKVLLELEFMGETAEKEFTVSGWYQGDSISHASQLYVSEAFWLELKGNRTEEDFKAWAAKNPQDKGVGLAAVGLYFDHASDIGRKVRTVIEQAGYIPETDVDYGVNWAYMQSRFAAVDPLTFFMAAGALAVILLTAYLIIYNIFQISVMTDIRFYGLLKTIGTTKRQLRRLITRQAALLSVAGIPAGLLAGYAIGKFSLPFMMGVMDYGTMEISLEFDPAVLVSGALFSAFTVWVSCRKPGRIAGSVSPVEAVKYTEMMQLGRRSFSRKRKRRPFSYMSMAFANLGRNRKKTGIVVAAVSLSMILLTLMMTAAGSFRTEQYLEQRIAGDVMIGSVDLLGARYLGSGYELDPQFVGLARSQAGIREERELWGSFSKAVRLDGKGLEQLRRLDAEGRLRRDERTQDGLDEMLEGNKLMYVMAYGYTDSLMKNLKTLEGTLDIEKFQRGGYILLTQFLGEGWLDAEDSLYHPGDKVTVSSVTEASKAHEVLDEAGETADVWYDNRAEKEYEVMAVVEMPYSLGMNRFSPNAMDVVLPLKEFSQGGAGSDVCFARSFEIEEEYRDAFEAAVKAYTETVNPYMGYVSKRTLENEFKEMTNVIATIGIVLAGVIAFIGILNFINAMYTGVNARRQEFAMLQSIGMTGGQLQKMLICEGISYVVFAGMVSFVLGSILAYAVLSALNNVILFFMYRFQILPFAIMLPVLTAVAVLTPVVSLRRLQRRSIVERLREAG